MKNIYFSLLFGFLSFSSFAQLNEGLTPEERAYLFHVVKKSPILDHAIGRYFDYKGPDIRFGNKELNYDSVELIIINDPTKLIIRNQEIGKSSKGILSEAANKVALWELNKILLAKRGDEKDAEPYVEKLAHLEALLIERVPEAALKEKDGVLGVNPKLYAVLHPSLSFDDKLALLESYRFLDQANCLVTMRALNNVINRYVEERSFELFQALGGRAEVYTNILIAAGDGSNTTGLLEEREKDERGRWNKGLPKAVGLFPYDVNLVTDEESNRSKIEPSRFTTTDLKTAGNSQLTNIHFDVWGYNTSRQTTVVIEKNGLNYPLFGSADTRFLSPDSTFSDGATFQAIINDLEKNKIGHIKELLYGRRGFENSIAYNKKRKTEVATRLQMKEKEYSDLHGTAIFTDKKAPKAVRKAKRAARKNNHMGGPMNYQPYTDSGKKRKGKLQNDIIYYNELYKQYERKIKELEEQRDNALALMAQYQGRLDMFKQLMGYRWASYKEEDGMYIFEDSSTFDLYTQDFKLKATKEKEPFEIRLISIPESCLSNQADEIMMHMNITDAKPNQHARIQLELNDQFASDAYTLNQPLFTLEDSVALVQFFEALQNKDLDLEIIARGQGVGVLNGCCVVKKGTTVEADSYPGETSEERAIARARIEFAQLRRSELYVEIDRQITVQINSFTDSIRSNLNISSPELIEKMRAYNLTKNDMLSAYRTATIMLKFKAELNMLAGTYLKREDAKIVIDRLNRQLDKTRITVGATSFKISELKL